jgi:hypothetical protein
MVRRYASQQTCHHTPNIVQRLEPHTNTPAAKKNEEEREKWYEGVDELAHFDVIGPAGHHVEQVG